MSLFHGLVLFQRHPVGGWRVFDAEKCCEQLRPKPLHKFFINHPTGHQLLGVYGTFGRTLRRGTWCKRPHKEIVHA